jgi:hypothetical protein
MQCRRHGRARRQNDIRPKRNQLGGESAPACAVGVGPALLDPGCAAVLPAQSCQLFDERVKEGSMFRVAFGHTQQHADHRHSRLLGARYERPSNRSTTPATMKSRRFIHSPKAGIIA